MPDVRAVALCVLAVLAIPFTSAAQARITGAVSGTVFDSPGLVSHRTPAPLARRHADRSHKELRNMRTLRIGLFTFLHAETTGDARNRRGLV
jgi:hypothetical protein